jgi:O-antigen/teichoic acid export membrane protein
MPMIRYAPAYIIPLLASITGIAVFTRLLPPHDYGIYAVILSLTQVAQSLLFTWLDLSTKRFYEPAQHGGKLGTLSKTIYVAMLAGAALLVLIALGAEAADWAGVATLDPGLVALLWLAVAVTILRELATSSKSFELAALSSLRFVSMECGDSLVALAVGVALCWFLGLGAAGILIGSAAGGLAVAIAGVPRLRQRLRGGAFDPALQRQLLRFGCPMALSYFFEYITASSDRLLIEHFLGASAVGIYAVSYSLANRAISAVFMVLTMSAYPLLIIRNEREGPTAARSQAADNVRLLLTFGLPALGGFIVLVPRMAGVLVGANYAPEAIRLMPLLAVGLFFFNLRMHYFAHALQLAHRTAQSLTSAIPAAVLNVAFNVVLLPRMGVMAAAWANLAAYVLGLAISIIQANRVFPMPFPLRTAASACTATLVMCALLWLLPFPGGLIGLMCQVVAGATTYGVLALALDIGDARRETTALAARLRARSA